MHVRFSIFLHSCIFPFNYAPVPERTKFLGNCYLPDIIFCFFFQAYVQILHVAHGISGNGIDADYDVCDQSFVCGL